MGFLMATPPATAQLAGTGSRPCVTTSTGTSGGQLTAGVLGASDVDSSKFREYRDVPEGFYVPCFNLFSTSSKVDFNRPERRQTDQRQQVVQHLGFRPVLRLQPDPHNMGGERTRSWPSCPPASGMSDTLQQPGHDRQFATASPADRGVLRRAARPDVRVGSSVDVSSHAQAGRPARPRRSSFD
jgi:hypothetical protein